MTNESTPYSSVSNCRYTDGSGGGVICSVQFLHIAGPVEFTALPNDVVDYGRDIYDRAVRGEFGAVAPFIPALPAPITITRYQALTALLDAGLLDDVEAIIEAGQDRRFKIWFENAQTWSEDHPHVQTISTAVNGLGPTWIRSFFENAREVT